LSVGAVVEHDRVAGVASSMRTVQELRANLIKTIEL